VPPTGYGVYGWSQRGGYGVVGESNSSIAVYGTSIRDTGVHGTGLAGVRGISYHNNGVGVLGEGMHTGMVWSVLARLGMVWLA
jgi:hypothetical protein